MMLIEGDWLQGVCFSSFREKCVWIELICSFSLLLRVHLRWDGWRRNFISVQDFSLREVVVLVLVSRAQVRTVEVGGAEKAIDDSKLVALLAVQNAAVKVLCAFEARRMLSR